jgi:hypothetical protein
VLLAVFDTLDKLDKLVRPPLQFTTEILGLPSVVPRAHPGFIAPFRDTGPRMSASGVT